MKHSIALLSLGLIISACAGSSNPAPYELRGGKFYGKNATSQYIDDFEDSDSSKDYVYKGRSGSGSSSQSYQDETDFSSPKKVYRSSDYDADKSVTSSKLAPPPKYESTATSGISEAKTSSSTRMDDHIDQYEGDSSGKKPASTVRVPTSRDNITSYNDEPAPKSKSSDYLDLKTVEDRPAAKKNFASEEKPITSGNYNSERSDKLKGVFPKEKPHFEGTELASNTNRSTSSQAEPAQEESPAKKALLNISAKEKPRHLGLADSHIEAKEKPIAHKEARKEAPEEEEDEPKVEAKAEPKPEPKPEVKPEPKQEAKVEPKPQPKAEPKRQLKETAESKEEDYISVPDKAPAAAKEPAIKEAAVKKAEVKPEVKKAELKEPKQEKLEIASAPEKAAEKKAEPEVKRQDIASIPKMEPASSSGPAKFIKPVEGKIVQEFGSGSDGITIQAPEGTPVKAASGGEVVYSGNELQGYGNMIVIKHPNGFLTAYSHLENLPIKKGEKVSQGEVIGQVGKTGNVQSPQLHFGVRKGRNAVNPRDYLN